METDKYQIIVLHLSDGRQLSAAVKEFCKKGDKLYLHPQFEVTEPREMEDGYVWDTMSVSPQI